MHLIGFILCFMAALLAPVFALAAGDPNCPPLTGLQKVAGFIDFLSILKISAIIGGVACAGYLLFSWVKWLRQLFMAVPLAAYEALGWIASIGAILIAGEVGETNRLWPLLGGCLGIAAMIPITSFIHNIKGHPRNYFITLTLVWSAAAVMYMDPVVAFFAVGALISALGFAFHVFPGFGWGIGFHGDEELFSGTAAAAVLTICGAALRINGGPDVLKLFETGLLWIGPFVLYLGLFIMASRWTTDGLNGTYVIRNLYMLVATLLGIYLGTVYDVGPLRGMAATWFVLWVLEKPFELPVQSRSAFAAIGLCVAVAVGAGVYWAQNHMDLVRPYLLF